MLQTSGGVALDEFYPNWAKKRIELGIPLDAFVLISVGELNTNKNNKVIIEAIAKLQKKNIHYCLCGVGDLRDYLQTQADNAGLHDNVHFLGYRSEVKDLLLMADVYVMPSIREGLSRSLMEAMACGLPCIVSKIRGNVDLIEENVGGVLCESDNVDSFVDAIHLLDSNVIFQNNMKLQNMKCIMQFDVDASKKELTKIYKELL